MTGVTVESGKIAKALKKCLTTGVLVWLPVAITTWATSYIISITDRLINLLPKSWQSQYFWGLNVPGLGIAVATIVLFVTGVFTTNVLDRRTLGIWDSLLGRTSVVRSIYSSVRKASESLLSDNSRLFKTPVLIPLPQPGIWMVAFASGHIPAELKNSLPQDDGYVSTYAPTTSNLADGYYIMVKKSDVRELDMSADRILKYVTSLGVVMPDNLSVKALFTQKLSKDGHTEHNS